MLIRKEFTEEKGILGIWKIEESSATLLSLFPEEMQPEARRELQLLRTEKRSLEWLSTRLMAMMLSGKEPVVIRNRKDGKPYLENAAAHITISHTKGYAAILLHETFPVGIDIEARSERVKKIASRLLSHGEWIDPAQESVHLLLHWSAKESLFKLMDEQEIVFRKHLHIHPFTPATRGVMHAFESRSGNDRSFDIRYEVTPEYVLTWVIDTAS